MEATQATQRTADLRNYVVVTGAYWADTITDGALRLLVLFYFYERGCSPIAVASLFLFYEFFGIVTNLVGGWLAARLGLRFTLLGGLGTQLLALGMLLAAPESWLVVPYVMVAQAFSGIAKDLTKMSSKSAIRLIVPEDAAGQLYRWVSLLTGSKNALKGVGFFLGGLLLTTAGFHAALGVLIGLVATALAVVLLLMRGHLGRPDPKAKFRGMFSNNRAVGVLAAARDLPVRLARRLVRRRRPRVPAAFPAAIAVAIAAGAGAGAGANGTIAVVAGLLVFGLVFALNSAVHSYLILAYADGDKVAMNVGFHYMANAGGRLAGTVLSGVLYQWLGLEACLWASAIFVLAAAVLSRSLPSVRARGVARAPVAG